MAAAELCLNIDQAYAEFLERFPHQLSGGPAPARCRSPAPSRSSRRCCWRTSPCQCSTSRSGSGCSMFMLSWGRSFSSRSSTSRTISRGRATSPTRPGHVRGRDRRARDPRRRSPRPPAHPYTQLLLGSPTPARIGLGARARRAAERAARGLPPGQRPVRSTRAAGFSRSVSVRRRSLPAPGNHRPSPRAIDGESRCGLLAVGSSPPRSWATDTWGRGATPMPRSVGHADGPATTAGMHSAGEPTSWGSVRHTPPAPTIHLQLERYIHVI